MFTELGGAVLGLQFEAMGASAGGNGKTEAGLLDLLVAVRNDVRAQKLWTLSDRIRDGLAKLGFVLEDKREGTVWKRTS
jgi:cysteinyl-tRNA synthetase